MVLSVVCVLCSCSSEPETLVTGGYDEQEMEAAIARARAEVDTFIAALEAGDGTDYSVKAPVADGDNVEHFWLTDVAYRNGSFEGRIGNDPGLVTNVRFGQSWTVARDEISDWMFLRDEKIHGNYTMRPLLATMSEDEADMWRSRFAEP
jgi:uncharacterized protein YegJ (DUF2314 family)